MLPKQEPDEYLQSDPYAVPPSRGARKEWTTAEIDMIRAGRQAGKPWKDITDEVNAAFGQARSTNSCRKILFKHGDFTGQWNDEKIAALRQAVKSGGAQRRQYMEALRALAGDALVDMSVPQIDKKFREIVRL